MRVAILTRLYRPSNGSEGEMFQEKWCYRCAKYPAVDSDVDCDILARSFWNDIDDPKYPKEWIQDANGDNPRCTAFQYKEHK